MLSIKNKLEDAVQRSFMWGLGRTAYRSDSVRTLHIPYGSHERQQLDLYLPRGKAVRGCAVFIHGGRWRSGHKNDYAFVGQSLAAHGVATAVVGYRLFPEVKFPAFVNDIALALHWLEKSAEPYGFDASSGIVMIGHSAGAHLASLVALNADYARQFDFSTTLIRGVVGMSGVYSLEPETSKLMTAIFQPSASPNNYYEINPINYLAEGGIPLRLIHGRKDQLVECDNAERMFKHALSIGHPAEIHVEDEHGHVKPLLDFNPMVSNHRVFMKKITSFVDEVINESIGDRGDGVYRAALCKASERSS